jgi:hypothetical protein
MLSNARRVPVIAADSRTILDTGISPTARLLYVVLLAFQAADISDPALARAVGIDEGDELGPYLDELTAAGVIDVIDHSRVGVRITAHQVAVAPAERVHACRSCPDCDACVCEAYRCLPYCEHCGSMREARQEAEKDIARWQAKLDAGGVYALGQHATKLHRWDCKLLNTVERGLALLEELEAGGVSQGGFWPRLPDLYTVEEMRARPKRLPSCQSCKPDLV